VRDISFCTDVFSSERTRDHSERALACLLWALVFSNEAFLLTRPAFPVLYSSGVRYAVEQPRPGATGCAGGNGQERFFGAAQVLAEGEADCEDLASWRVAEVRLGRGADRRGPPARAGHPPVIVCTEPYPLRAIGPAVVPGFFWRQPSPNTIVYHIVVVWPDGYIEDPSRALGMGGEFS
jgi:hypothetical protein